MKKVKELQKVITGELTKERLVLKEKVHILETTRAGKLLLKGKPFIVVACDEPYYLEVYKTIRHHELRKGTWTEHCESEFREAIDIWMGY